MGELRKMSYIYFKGSEEYEKAEYVAHRVKFDEEEGRVPGCGAHLRDTLHEGVELNWTTVTGLGRVPEPNRKCEQCFDV